MERIPDWAWLLLALAGIVVLVLVGQRVAPFGQASNSAETRHTCKMEAPDQLKTAGAHWCGMGLFSQVTITEDKENVIAVLLFSPNGAQAWQMQSGGIINEFKQLTDRTATDAGGRNVAVDVHDSMDKRIATCARLSGDASATCEVR
ncbi:MAG TPA: hypothetical protein VFZ31_11530 [Vicinamibacterales bacterium]